MTFIVLQVKLIHVYFGSMFKPNFTHWTFNTNSMKKEYFLQYYIILLCASVYTNAVSKSLKIV